MTSTISALNLAFNELKFMSLCFRPAFQIETDNKSINIIINQEEYLCANDHDRQGNIRNMNGS